MSRYSLQYNKGKCGSDEEARFTGKGATECAIITIVFKTWARSRTIDGIAK